MQKIIFATILMLMACGMAVAAPAATSKPVPFVVQLTRSAEDHGHRRVFLQIDKVLSDLGEKNLNIVVIAYEEGIHALLANNPETSQLLTKLANQA